MPLSMRSQSATNRLFRGWFAIAAPPAAAADAPRKERELTRKGRFISLVVLIIIVLNIPVYFMGDGLILNTPLSVCILLLCIGLVLNRMGKTRLAGILTVATLELNMCTYLIMSGLTPPGFTPMDIAACYMLLEPTLIAIALFPPKITLPLGLFNSLFILTILAFLPKTPDLMSVISMNPLAVFYVPISNMIIVTLVSILWASSTMREMKRADRAEEVNKLTQALAIRQQLALQEKQQLEASIQKISAIHAQVVDGNYQVRVPIDQQDALLSISATINELLTQLQHKQGVENAVMQAFQDIQQAKQQGKPIQPRKTGTIVDELLAEATATQPSSMTTPQHTPWHPITPPLLNLPGYINTPREQPVYKKHP